MSLAWTLIIGFIVGLIAKTLTTGRDLLGFMITSVLGMTGAFVAHYFGQTMGWYADGSPAGFVASVVGAIFILGLYGLATEPRSVT
jgi:uncharacterized membrane protein YeaQ/YmgE (transglycosylase-associated protein family)